MQLRSILTLILAMLVGGAQAQIRGDDQAILDMQQAFRDGNRTKLTQLLPRARGHVLEPWAAYWELRARLDTASGAEIQEFLTRYAGTYQEDRMRNDWLQLLGQRRDWTTFAAEYPKYRMNDDREVRCYALFVSDIQNGGQPGPGVAEEVRKLWMAQGNADDGCTFAMSRLVDAQGSRRITTQDIWRKARLAVEAGRTRAATAAVEIVAPQALPDVAALTNSPTRFLTSRVFAASRARREMVVLALVRMATADLDHAAAQLDEKWGPQLAPEERNWVWGVIAKLTAQRLGSGDDALALYAKVSRDTDLTDDMLAWKARAALRGARGPQWRELLQAVDAMSDTARGEPVWVYWKARALRAQGGDERKAQAQQLFQSIASVRGFYEQLALEETGQPIAVPPRPEPPTAEEKAAVRANPGLQRALAAIGLGLRSEGVREWNYSTNLAKGGGPLDDRELLAAAQLACEREIWDRCINTSERTRSFFDADQRFPTPHRELVVRRSGEIGLDPAYVYGLIRQESRFVTDARSSVGAGGLMQVMPATARWTARKLGIPFSADRLHDRDTNIALGTGYLKLVLDDFEGSMPLAAAAYNAGPRRPRAWRNGPVMDAAAWAENVPFGETRDYVKKVLANTTLYAAILTGQPQSLKARLGRIGPRNSPEPDSGADLP